MNRKYARVVNRHLPARPVISEIANAMALVYPKKKLRL